MAFFNTLIPLSFFFFFLLSSSSSTSTPPLSSSTHAAANALRNRGYSLFASTIDYSTNKNFSGTIFAPPDFIFSSSNILINRRSPPRPSSILLRYHTLYTPLTWAKLLSHFTYEIPTLYDNNCLFFFVKEGEISISSNSVGGVVGTVNIKQPDIYVDDYVTVHGIDGVLDPTSAKKCSFLQTQKTGIVQYRYRRSLLDHAIRALRRRRVTVAATALAIKRTELLSLSSVSVFAPSDMALFSNPDGFRYDFRHHVVPKRYRFGDLAGNGVVVLETLAPNKKLVVKFVDGFVTVNGISVNSTEVYRNRWIVVLSVSMSLDDAGSLLDSGNSAPSLAPATMEIRYPDEIRNGFNDSVQSPSPETVEIHYPGEIAYGFSDSVPSRSPATMEIRYPDERIDGFSASVPSPSSPAKMEIRYPDEIHNGFNDSVQSPSPETVEIHYPGEIAYGFSDSVPSPSPATMEIRYPDERIDGFSASVPSPSSPVKIEIRYPDDRIIGFNAGAQSPSPAKMESNVNDPQCVFGIPAGIDGGDLLCPASRHLQEKEDLIEEHVARYPPLDVKDQLAEDVNQSLPLISNAGEKHSSRKNIIDQNHQDHLNIADDLFFYL